MVFRAQIGVRSGELRVENHLNRLDAGTISEMCECAMFLLSDALYYSINVDPLVDDDTG